MDTTDLEDDGRDMNPLAPVWENTQGTIEGEKAAERNG